MTNQDPVKPTRRDVLAGISLGLAALPSAAVGEDNLDGTEIRRLISAWRAARDAHRVRAYKGQEERFDGHLREVAAARAAGLAIRRSMGLYGLDEPPVVAIVDGSAYLVNGDAGESSELGSYPSNLEIEEIGRNRVATL